MDFTMTSDLHRIPFYYFYIYGWINEQQQQIWIVDDEPVCTCVNIV